MQSLFSFSFLTKHRSEQDSCLDISDNCLPLIMAPDYVCVWGGGGDLSSAQNSQALQGSCSLQNFV